MTEAEKQQAWRECACCGEVLEPFLALGHVNLDGAEHRRRPGSQSSVIRDLRRLGWPSDGRLVLCMNCNSATRYGAPCPHYAQEIT